MVRSILPNLFHFRNKAVAQRLVAAEVNAKDLYDIFILIDKYTPNYRNRFNDGFGKSSFDTKVILLHRIRFNWPNKIVVFNTLGAVGFV